MSTLVEMPGRCDSPDDQRWTAVRNRDKAADGTFVYAVKSTGVFCRPSCHSRLPNRENVSFFADLEQAVRAGFRACKKCRPAEAGAGVATGIIAACRQIESAETVPELEELARMAGLSVFHFQKRFKSVVGVTPKAYALAKRGIRLRRLLRPDTTVTEVIYDAGYQSSTRFYATAQEQLGMSPLSYRDGGQGAEIRFAVGSCSLGAILVAATPSGICAIDLGDDAEVLLQLFQSRFPKAELIGSDPEFEKIVATVILQVDNPRIDRSLPLDIQGTAFQQLVWQELRKIPAGTIISYAELAEKLGRPAAVRAVAGACAANKIAIAIPCHRVVRSDGNISGYRWGIDRKRVLLDKERS